MISATREMVLPFQTAGGAQVLAPDWDAINPVLLQMFGRKIEDVPVIVSMQARSNAIFVGLLRRKYRSSQ